MHKYIRLICRSNRSNGFSFVCRENTGNFYLTDLYAADETELCDPTPVLNLNRKEGKRPAVFLRFK